MEQWNEHWLPFELEAFLRKRREKEGKGGKRRRRQNQHGELSASQALNQARCVVCALNTTELQLQQGKEKKKEEIKIWRRPFWGVGLF